MVQIEIEYKVTGGKLIPPDISIVVRFVAVGWIQSSVVVVVRTFFVVVAIFVVVVVVTPATIVVRLKTIVAH